MGNKPQCMGISQSTACNELILQCEYFLDAEEK
jgi:hypothetical protein